MSLALRISFLLIFSLLITAAAIAQCSSLGQRPSTAFPVCGTTVFQQSTVPLCSSHDLFVPGCPTSPNVTYRDLNPFWYKFTCFQSGTLGFTITPHNVSDDYDWQLYDITGLDPDDVFTNRNIIVTGNWSATPGATGTSSNGVNFIQCASQPQEGKPTFAKMPNLIAGHEYILLVSNFSSTQLGYDLKFNGGTAVITDPKEPDLSTVIPDCDGKTLTLKLNKSMKCISLTNGGTEFSISPAITNVVSAVAKQCSRGFDMTEIEITLANALPSGTYDLVINNGSDGNTLLDNCDRAIPVGQKVSFVRNLPEPIFADSVGSLGCSPDELLIYFPKKIICNSISANGSDFSISGPSSLTVIGASGDCEENETGFVRLQLAGPVLTGGTYTISLKAGTDGSVLVDECGLETPLQTISFTAYDTVSAVFDISTILGCRMNNVSFSHNGDNGVDQWNWTFDTLKIVGTSSYNTDWPASSQHTVSLGVSNGVCKDSTTIPVVFDNEVKANFEMPGAICPEDSFYVQNKSTGIIDSWTWSFGNNRSSILQDPKGVKYPETNIETNYRILLTVRNNELNCVDTMSRVLKVLDNCYIAVPTAFTPNGDGLNDQLWPHNAIKAENLSFRIYNRWGQLVFHSRRWDQKWDGKINGVTQGAGVYVWQLEYTEIVTGKKIFQKGTSVLIR